jgi:hypothetical protein
VRECTASGSPRSQLRTGTFIAGSEATGETLARAMALEVATAPYGSSSGGFTFTFDLASRTFQRRAGTFGPAFSERALTIGRGKLSAGFNYLPRSYDEIDGLKLRGFDVFRFDGGNLPVTLSTFDLKARTETVALFANVGVLDNLDVGVVVPYEHVSLTGTSRIFGESNTELQRVFLDADTRGVGDIGLFAKYRFWTAKSPPAEGESINGGLAAAITVRVPSGDVEKLTGLGVTRALMVLIGSTTIGRFSPHVNVGYELWSADVPIPRDFQDDGSTIGAKNQVQYSAGVEYEVHPTLSLMVDVLGRQLRGTGSVGYQPFTFPTNVAAVKGADALVAIPGAVTTVFLAPGVKWNVFHQILVNAHALVALTDNGLRSHVTPVIGLDWAF